MLAAYNIIKPETNYTAILTTPDKADARPHLRQAGPPHPSDTTYPDHIHEHILAALKATTGHDFRAYKKLFLIKCIARCMTLLGIQDHQQYFALINRSPDETSCLFKEILVNSTCFFRDNKAYDALTEDSFPQLFHDRVKGDELRVWVAGCATGEEAYSVAILLFEYMQNHNLKCRVRLFATDLNEEAINFSRAAIYPDVIACNMNTERLKRYFDRNKNGYRVKKFIRKTITFETQNLLTEQTYFGLDLLCCRNLLIYLEQEAQNHLIGAFHKALKPGGVLFLSPSENTGNHHEFFSAINRRWKLYRARYHHQLETGADDIHYCLSTTERNLVTLSGATS